MDFEISGSDITTNQGSVMDGINSLDDNVEKGIVTGNSNNEITEKKDQDKDNKEKNSKKEPYSSAETIENSYKRQHKHVESMDKQNETDEKTETLENKMDVRESVDGSHYNDESDRDVKQAFDYVDLMDYSKDSSTWQETAIRYEEILNEKLENIKHDYSGLEGKCEDAQKEVNKIINKYELTPENCNNNKEYVKLNTELRDLTSQFNKVKLEKSTVESKLEYIKSFIKPETRNTTCSGFNDTSFKDSYNAFITNPQGRVIKEAGGTCSICDMAGRANQQFGTSYSEKSMFSVFRDYGKCTWKDLTPDLKEKEIESVIADNGGTIAREREFVANKIGLDYDYGSAKKNSLEKMKSMMDKGYSIGIGLRGQDLSQNDITTRTRGIFGLKRSDTANRANHMVSVADFTVDKNGKVVGIWVNDTGGFTSSNRIFISAEKYESMAKNTVGMSVEYCKAKDDTSKPIKETKSRAPESNTLTGNFKKESKQGEVARQGFEKMENVDLDTDDLGLDLDDEENDKKESNENSDDKDVEKTSNENSKDESETTENKNDSGKAKDVSDKEKTSNEPETKLDEIDKQLEKIEVGPIKKAIQELLDSEKVGEVKLPKGGTWSGEKGNSFYTPDTKERIEALRSYGKESIEYKDNKANFEPFKYDEFSEVQIDKLSIFRGKNFARADIEYAKARGITPKEARAIRKENSLTWHEVDSSGKMILVPRSIHKCFPHSGGISEVKKQIVLAIKDDPTKIGSINEFGVENKSFEGVKIQELDMEDVFDEE